MAFEVESPCTPTPSVGCGGSVAEVADILICSISIESQFSGRGIAYDCEHVVLVLSDTQCTYRVREYMHKLSDMGSRVDLPNLGRIDQCHEDLAVRANGDVLNPLRCMSIIVSDRDSETND